ncbi:hypothetical protein [uncultured Sphingomonas sp.]|uniref:spike base protein, RCAP_Rcc01079 family n=1 Tax=uncultured Sphingomonas sp. TaxID=158754 RepID=UPI0035CB5A8C
MSDDPFRTHADGLSASARAPFAVNSNDADELPTIPKALYVGTGGHVTLRGVDAAADVVFRNVASGQVLDVRARFVRAGGTTASDIVGLV